MTPRLWFIALFLATAGLQADSLVRRGPWYGAVTPTSVVIKAKLTTNAVAARLAFTTRADFAKLTFTPLQLRNAEAADLVTFALSGLRPDTTYHYVLEVDGRRESELDGEFRTFPKRAASFTFSFASCQRTGSDHRVFDTIREHHPLFHLCTGDFHYEDIRTNVPGRFWAAYDRVFKSPRQALLYRHVPLAYIWDDHDFTGNDSDDRSRAHPAARLAYRQYIPHYPLPAGGPDAAIYQTFEVGRAKFILTDLRSERQPTAMRDGPAKSMLGEPQKAWLKRELLAANGKFPLIFWVSSVPWLGNTRTNYYWPVGTNTHGFIHHTNLDYSVGATNRHKAEAGYDTWAAFATERRELSDFIQTNHIRGLVLLHGDQHALAADDGSHNWYSSDGHGPGFPILAAAPLDQESSIKGGPYSQGVYAPFKGEGCFGWVTVTDRGRTIDVEFSGRTQDDVERVSLRFSVPAKWTFW